MQGHHTSGASPGASTGQGALTGQTRAGRQCGLAPQRLAVALFTRQADYFNFRQVSLKFFNPFLKGHVVQGTVLEGFKE